MIMKVRSLLPAVCLLAFTATVSGYFLSPPHTIEKLAEEADIIFKGTAISSELSKDDWFKPSDGLVVMQTKFRIISMIKGDSSAEILRYNHNDKDPTGKKRISQAFRRNRELSISSREKPMSSSQ